MLFLTFSSPTFVPDYQNIISGFIQNNIQFKLFCPKDLLNSLNLPDEAKPFVEPSRYKINPWIKDYAPAIYLSPGNTAYPNGIVFGFEYKPFYLNRRSSKCVDAFVLNLARNYINKAGIPVIFLPGSLDVGAVHTIYNDQKVFFITAGGWDFHIKFSWISLFGAPLGLEFDYFELPVEERYKHVDGILNVFPSLIHKDTFCVVCLKNDSKFLYLRDLFNRLETFLHVSLDVFEFPVRDDYHKFTDYRDPIASINAVVLRNKKLYSFLIYEPKEEVLCYLDKIGFFNFLAKHGYKPLPIVGENLLKSGGGLACATYNAWFLSQENSY